MSPRSSVRVLLSAVIALLVPTVFLAPTAQAAGVSASASVVESTPTRLAIHVEGSGYSEEQPGIYVGLSESGGASAVDASVYRGTKFLKPTDLPGGAFDVTLELDADAIATLDPAKSYSVYTLKAHGQAASDSSQNAEVPVSIDFSTLTQPDDEGDGSGVGDGSDDGDGSGDGDGSDDGDGGSDGDDSETVAPSVQVSQTEFSADGSATVTVTGSGFDPSLATGTRPPFAGQPGGAYVVFGKFAEQWCPSQNAAAATRVIGDQKWAVPAAQATSDSYVVLSEAGSFTAELTVDKSAIDAIVAGKANAADLVNYGVYTYAGSGASVAEYETYTPVTFTEPEPAGPSLQVDVTEQVKDSLKLSVTGLGYAKEFPGVYVTLAPSGGADTQNPGAHVKAVYVSQNDMDALGGFSTELALNADDIEKLDPAVDYSVYTFRAHGIADPGGTQSVEVPVDLDIAVLQGSEEPAGPSLSVDVVEQVEGSLKVKVDGAGYATGQPGVYVGISESGGASATDASVYRGTKWVQPAQIGEGGTFSVTLELDEAAIATLDPSKSYSVYSLKAHGQAATDPSQTVEQPIDLDIDLLQGNVATGGPALTVQTVEQVEGRLKLSVTGLGYAKQFPGVYVTLAPSGGADTQDAGAHVTAVWVKDSDMDALGGFTTELDLTPAEIAALDPDTEYSVYTIRAHGFADLDPSQTVEKPVALDIGLLQGGGTDPVDPGDGDDNGTDTPNTKTKGSLRWGVKSAFRSYVTGPIANGAITVSGGASASGGSYRFYQKSTSADANGTGVTRYGGAVTFTGHGGVLNLRIADPVITVQSASRGTLSAVMGGSRITVATLDLSRASKSTKAGAVTFSGAPATLTAQGAGSSGFQGYYSAGESLDPVTFTIGADGGAASGSRTVATAVTKAEFTPPSTAPATTGLNSDELSGEDGVRAGDLIEASGDGFQPNETGIAVVVYSTPIVLSQSVTADSQGRASWSGPLPGSLEPGEHTLTFQGSVSRGMTFTVAEDESTIGRCTVEDATLDWGVKESWRAYVSGSIANGEWTTTGNASYETPTFTFAKGSGTFDAKASSGDITFDGAIDFTGHHGALKVVLADPVVRIVDEDSAILMIDVTAGDREAAETGDASTTTTKAVPFAEIDLSKATTSADGTTLTVDDAPASLTEQGHQVFSTYETGAALDPIDLTVSTADDCAAAPTVAEKDSSAAVAPVDDDGIPLAWWIGGALILLLALGSGVWLGRRRTTE